MTSRETAPPNGDPPPARPSDDPFAARLRGFGPLGILAMLVVFLGDLLFKPLSAILVLLWAQRSRTPWREIGYVRPESWGRTVAVGLVFGISFKIAMKAIVMPLLGADPINRAYHFVAGNPAALPGMIYAVVVGAGFGEETVFRGFLFERMGKLFGESPRAKAATVAFSAVLFGLAHFADQGIAGVEQATVTGLIFGTVFAITGRLGMLMIAHAAFDLTALGIIYWNVETDVAHLVFR